MKLFKARQLLKSIADDTRMRILNLLGNAELNVAELCEILVINQSTVSKHLSRLRLTSLVGDKREGQFVYYHLLEPSSKFQKAIIKELKEGESDIEEFMSDIEKMKEVKDRSRYSGIPDKRQ
jgi:ArsR family transcriptional regulator